MTHGNRWSWSALAVVVVIASVLRFGGITKVGIRFDDEGAYVGDSRLWHRCALLLADRPFLRAVMHADKPAAVRRVDDLGVDFNARYDKPSQGYTVLGAMVMFVVGDRPAALLVLNALCGVLSVIVLWAIGTALFGPATGICAALFLAVSPYHLVYCRSAFTEATAGFFVLLGWWFWIGGLKKGWPVRRTYGLCGVALGYAITCHYRSLYVPAVLMLADTLCVLGRNPDEGVWGRQGCLRRRFGSLVGRWSWLLAGVALPAVLIELVFRAARLAATISDSFFPLKTFLEAWIGWIKMVMATGPIETAGATLSPLGNAWVFLSYFVHWHGVAAVLLVLTGFIVVLRQRRQSPLARGMARTPALLAGITLILLFLQPYVVARAMSTATAPLCLCAAVGAFWLMARVGRHARLGKLLGGVLLVFFLKSSVTGSLDVYRQRSSIKDACAFITSHGPAQVAIALDTYYHSKYWLYLEGSGVEVRNERWDKLGTPQEVLARLRREGVRWFIVDPQPWHFRDRPPTPRNTVFRWWESMQTTLRREARTAAVFPHVTDFTWEFLAEGPGLTFLNEMNQQQAGRLRVYELAEPSPYVQRF